MGRLVKLGGGATREGCLVCVHACVLLGCVPFCIWACKKALTRLSSRARSRSAEIALFLVVKIGLSFPRAAAL